MICQMLACPSFQRDVSAYHLQLLVGPGALVEENSLIISGKKDSELNRNRILVLLQYNSTNFQWTILVNRFTLLGSQPKTGMVGKF